MHSSRKKTEIISLLIQLAGWLFFIGNPIFLKPELFSGKPLMLIEFAIQHFLFILFFYFNYFYLIPQLLHKKGLGKYALMVLATCILVLALNNIVFQVVMHPPHFKISLRSFVAIVQLYAISTSLRMLTDYIIENQKKKTLEKEKLNAELGFLRSQINPHFLFNTLNNINSLIRLKPDEAEKAVVRLSYLMRYMLNSGQQEKISLTDEMKYLENYIELQKLRLPSEFNLKVEIGNYDGSLKIEPLLLICFIENPFKHAISGNDSDFIHIRIETTKSRLILLISNSVYSPNINPEIESGIGIDNTVKRLNLCYPGKYGLDNKKTDTEFTTLLMLDL